MDRYWKVGPAIQQDRLSSKQYAITFTISATRSDGVRCYVQETHEFHIGGFDTATIMAEAKDIADKMRARFDTYLDPRCTCNKNGTRPRCPVQHARVDEG